MDGAPVGGVQAGVEDRDGRVGAVEGPGQVAGLTPRLIGQRQAVSRHRMVERETAVAEHAQRLFEGVDGVVRAPAGHTPPAELQDRGAESVGGHARLQ